MVKVNLIEFIYPKMDLLFVALNAPEFSNANTHWFSYNLSFWNLLNRAGIITQSIHDPLKGDLTVFGDIKINYTNWLIGVTDLNREVVSTQSSLVVTHKGQVERILSIAENNSVKKIYLMHSKVAEEFELNGIISRNNKKVTNEFGMVGKYIKQQPFMKCLFIAATQFPIKKFIIQN